MEKLWITEKKSLVTEAILPTILGQNDQNDITERYYIKRGNNHFIWLDGHALMQAMPDYYLPDNIAINKNGNKIWRMCDLPIIPQSWVLLEAENKTERLRKLQNLLKDPKITEVMHVGDIEPEGQLIVDEVLNHYKNNKPVRRVLINDYNMTEVKKALNNTQDNNDDLFVGWYKSALARARFDWLFGLNATRAMSLKAKENGAGILLTMGSVQTPLLYVVRERDRAIDSFTPQLFFKIHTQCVHANGVFIATWIPSESQTGLDSENRLSNAEVANAIAGKVKNQTGKVLTTTKERKVKTMPLPLDLDELSMLAFKYFDYTPEEVLEASQILYQTYKVLTYPRTDNRYLSEEQHLAAPRVFQCITTIRPDFKSLVATLNPLYKSKAFNDKKMEGTPHHGIVPTVAEGDINYSDWTEKEKNIYELVVRYYLAQFSLDYQYDHSTIDLIVSGESFKAQGNIIVEMGWKTIFDVYKIKSEQENNAQGKDEETEMVLPIVQEGDVVTCQKFKIESCKTKAPPRFDYGLLLDAMKNIHRYVDDPILKSKLREDDGIGTPATKAKILKDLIDRGFIEPLSANSKKLKASEKGVTLIDFVPLKYKEPSVAAQTKIKLTKIAKNEISFEYFMADAEKFVAELVDTVKSQTFHPPVNPDDIVCPTCNSGVLKKSNGKYGMFWFCTNWNRVDDPCKAKFDNLRGKPVTTVQYCNICKTGILKRKEGQYGAFWGCSNWNRVDDPCKAVFEDVKGKLGGLKAKK